MRTPTLADLLDLNLRLDRLGGASRELSVEADAETRAALAARIGLSAVEAMRATMTAKRFRGGIRVSGRLTAEIVQPCVVTLEPVSQAIDEEIDRVFLPASQRPRDPEPGVEHFVELEGEDPPDYIEGPELDLSELVIETLSLAVDPYPRAPDADLEALGLTGDAPEPSPFARLKDLKTDKDG